MSTMVKTVHRVPNTKSIKDTEMIDSCDSPTVICGVMSQSKHHFPIFKQLFVVMVVMITRKSNIIIRTITTKATITTTKSTSLLRTKCRSVDDINSTMRLILLLLLRVSVITIIILLLTPLIHGVEIDKVSTSSSIGTDTDNNNTDTTTDTNPGIYNTTNQLSSSDYTDQTNRNMTTDTIDTSIISNKNPIIDSIVSFFQLNQYSNHNNNNDSIEDSFYDPLQADSDCDNDIADVNHNNHNSNHTNTTTTNCHRWSPPDSTIEEIEVIIDKEIIVETLQFDATCSYGGADPDDILRSSTTATSTSSNTCQPSDATTTTTTTRVIVDKHWGSDPTILRMRDQLRQSGSGCSIDCNHHNDNNSNNNDTITSSSTTTSSDNTVRANHRPPIFLMPGLASTRLVAWKYKRCSHHPLLSDIRVQDYVWLNINLIMQMSTIDASCMSECLRLGKNQSDTDDMNIGCKLRPDEGLDAISSLSPGGIGSQLLVGGTNTVYAWLIQWCADNMGYDVSNIIGLPYDWRLSPDKMESRDGFLTLTRRRIEAAVQTNGKPGIMVAHSMGNIIFRYFLLWIRNELQKEAYERFIRNAKRRMKAMELKQQQHQQQQATGGDDNTTMTTTNNNNNNLESKPTTSTTTTSPNERKAALVNAEINLASSTGTRHAKLWELAQLEGDTNWYEWIETHIWTYVGLSAPLLGAVNPLRAVISGENMGLPVTDQDARIMELTFGSTHTVNPMSTKNAFCDQWEIHDRWDEEPKKEKKSFESKLTCLDDIATEIDIRYDEKNYSYDPWDRYPSLKSLLHDRSDWDTNIPMIRVTKEVCEEKEKRPCANNSTIDFGPTDVETGRLFTEFNHIWKEPNEPLIVKREQLRESFWDTEIPNILNETWERPLIKHVIMAYGVDLPTEIAYEYVNTERETLERKDSTKGDHQPMLQTVYWETAGGAISAEYIDQQKSNKLTDFWKKRQRREPLRNGKLHHSGDGSVPYLSLAWSHTWLLHSIRAQRYSGQLDSIPLDDIEIRHRPEGAMEWLDGPPPNRKPTINSEKKVEESSDTGTTHPHGTKYKPEMVRYHNIGTSRTTGINYTTTIIEALMVEHKETTRNYDILAAVFSDVLKFMHDDLTII